MRLLPYGDDAVLVELDSNDELSPAQVWRALGAAGGPAITEVVPAARTVLVRFVPGTARPDLAALLATETGPVTDEPSRDELRLPVRYDGPDLDDLAAELGCSAQALVARHAAGTYTVAFCGFAPGFGYLRGLPPELHAPRLPQPRSRVPAGAVAIAGEYTGVYPRSSPGGWRLIGRTDLRLWDTTATPPALLTPGRRVRFEAL